MYSQEDPYSAGGPANAQPPPNQQQYNAYAPPQYPPQQQPSYEPPAPPTGNAPPPPNMGAGYPALHDARQTLPSQGGAPQGQYKPYQRPGSSEGQGGLGAPSAPPGGPADFYRQSAAY